MAMDNSFPINNDEASNNKRSFIHDIIDEHNTTGRFEGRVFTRFPPEPNGYLHIGHAASICLNFGIAEYFGGKTNLRFDDTNPTKENQEYIDAIIHDVSWLGFQWENLLYASDYFEQLYQWAEKLVLDGKAYVDQLSVDEIREYRGTLTTPGKNSPWRDRPIDENLDLFRRMRSGEFETGAMTLRAKIDMTSPNINLRDPVMYRILHAHHPRTGNDWCIYPMYDWAHGQSDSIEGITHSICTMEYAGHRPLYEWFVEQLGIYMPQQIEFARVNVTYLITSKRKLLRLVNEKIVRGWDDPRMATIAAMRRRGYTPKAIRDFADQVGVSRSGGIADIQLLEYCVRQDLNKIAPRVMGVLRPIKVVLTNYPEGQTEWFDSLVNPEQPELGTRQVPFSRELYIESEDFMEVPPSKFYRLSPGKEVRLRSAYFIKCNDVIKDEDGNVMELLCTYDPETQGGNAKDGRQVKATLHWVSVAHAIPVEVRLYDLLLTVSDPADMDDNEDLLNYINPMSLEIIDPAYVEPSVMDVQIQVGKQLQFERVGYFTIDPDSTPEKLVFNRTVTLKDQWTKVNKQGKPS